MPPHSSPATTPVTIDHNNYLEDLGQLATPVPDLAATLTTAAERDGEDNGFSPQRSPPPITSPGGNQDENSQWQRPPYLNSPEFHHAHVQREMQRRALRRAASQNRSPGSMDVARNTAVDQSPRRPSSRYMSYHNWAPGSSDTDSGRLRTWSASTRSWQERATSPTPDPYRNHQRETDPTLFDEYPRSRNYDSQDSGLHNGQSYFVEDNVNPDAVGTEPSLRTTALLQSVRRSARATAATSRDQLENWIAERARRRGDVSPGLPVPPYGPTRVPSHQGALLGASSSTTSSSHSGPSAMSSEEQIRTQQHRLLVQQQQEQYRQQRQAIQRQQEQHRQARLQRQIAQQHQSQQNFTPVDYSPTSQAEQSENARLLEEAIKYLERQRSCTTYAERIASAAMGGFIRGDWFNTKHDDFVFDTHSIDPPTETSWLRPGSVFSGSQHASNAQNAYLSAHGSSTLSQYYSAGNTPYLSTHYLDFSPNNNAPLPPDLRPARVSVQSGSYLRPHILNPTYLEQPTTISSNGAPDTWPVKVTIHTIDFDTMTLTGTMEAFDVPDKSASYPASSSLPPTKKPSTSITTFLTGELLDFNLHTLLTTSWNAKVAIDSTYWRKLGPFKALSEKEIVAGLTSRKWMREEVYEKWILMRWKEKCFVTPSDAQSGLTISGFYYVCLRREDGFLEGLYYDPLSSPYQHLELRAVGRGGGSSYGFR